MIHLYPKPKEKKRRGKRRNGQERKSRGKRRCAGSKKKNKANAPQHHEGGGIATWRRSSDFGAGEEVQETRTSKLEAKKEINT